MTRGESGWAFAQVSIRFSGCTEAEFRERAKAFRALFADARVHEALRQCSVQFENDGEDREEILRWIAGAARLMAEEFPSSSERVVQLGYLVVGQFGLALDVAFMDLLARSDFEFWLNAYDE